MLRGLFEGWHLVILIILVLLLFGGKRLPDAARGLGRSLRIFKSEVSEMKEEDRARSSSTPKPPAPLEGRIVDDETTRTATPSEQSRDA